MAEYYVQDAPDLPVAIHVNLEAVDRIGQEVMSGFGKIPRRGAEVGGILLGTVADGERPVVRIDDFVPVTVEYRFGPAWLLSDADEAALAEALRQAGAGEALPVGLVRSNTRPDQNLTDEDVTLLGKYFPERPRVMLMIKPFATKPSVASFYASINGPFKSGMAPGPEFPFRRRALSTTEESPEHALEITGPRGRRRPPQAETLAPVALATEEPPQETALVPAEAALPARIEAPARAERPSAWIWVPLSFIFLLLGVLLGFQAAIAFRNAGTPPDPYDLHLTVSKSGSNLTVKWDHASAAIRAAQRGTLFIEEGAQERPVELGATELTSGTVVYSPSSSRVEFRLQVFPSDSASVTQTVDWGQ